MAALLIQAAESRMQRFAPRQRRERLRNSLQVALTHRQDIKHVAIFGYLPKQCLRAAQRLGEPALLEQAAQALYLELDAAGGVLFGREAHGCTANRPARPTDRARP